MTMETSSQLEQDILRGLFTLKEFPDLPKTECTTFDEEQKPKNLSIYRIGSNVIRIDIKEPK